MDKPQVKNEIVVERCENKKALSIHTATERASKRVLADKAAFSDDWLFSTDRKVRAPDKHVIVVSPCFNIDEVEAYLNRSFE